MTGFEPWTSGIGSDQLCHITTAAQLKKFPFSFSEQLSAEEF